jgi:oligopeptidase B
MAEQTDRLRPPLPERRPTVIEAHGDKRTDDFYWLRDREDPAVLTHLELEHAYADSVLARLGPLQETIFQEMKARIAETDMSTPVRDGPWWYFQRTYEGKSYPVHCRRPVEGDDPPVDVAPDELEQVLLDENVLAEGLPYLEVANLVVSPDHRRLAFGTDTSGGELYDLVFRSLAPGVDDVPETVPATYYGLAWTNDNGSVFYTRVDHAMRPYQVWRHVLGTDPAEDALILQEDDERFNLSVGKTKDDVYICVVLESHTTSEWWVVPADDPTVSPRIVQPRRQDIEYSVEHHNGWFVGTTNDGAEDFRVVAVPAAGPGGDGVPLVPHRPGVRIEGVDVFQKWLVIGERLEGEPVLRVVEIPGTGIAGLAEKDLLAMSNLVPSKHHPAVTWEGPNPEPSATALRFEQTSLVQPRTASDFDPSTGAVVVRKRQPVLGGYDESRYLTYRIWITAPDGAHIPMSVVHRADLLPDGGAVPGTPGATPAVPAPCLLYGYGAYEASIDPVFSPMRLSLLDRGVIFAIAHVRGGGELGRRWYLDGKTASKEHTVTDFVACARYLVDAGFTAPNRLAARGRSAGGLLMGAVVNQAPDLFAAVVAEVPFVDCLTTMLDESLPLTVGEFEEWGDPVRDPVAYATIKAYSPYDNIRGHDEDGRPVPHPRIFATGALNDPRVGFWEPAKWTAKLRVEVPNVDVVFRPELSAGHGGRSGRYDAWRDEALVYAFVLDAIGAA